MDSEPNKEQNLVEPPAWRRDITPLSHKEKLRRKYKKLFGWKPCDLSIKELEREINTVELRQAEASTHIKQPKNPTIGDMVQSKKLI